MQIKQIVLYSRWGDIRVLDLRLGQLNVITGKSKTGKSAIGRIIEYVLGSDEFGVPLGTIRNTTSWYALTLSVGETEAFLARPDPGSKASTGDIYFQVGSPISLPSFQELKANSNVDATRKRLGQMIGLSPNATEPLPGQIRRPYEAQLSHALFYCFQGQNVVANNEVLFHKQNEEFVPQAIRDTFPYFLGAVEEDRLEKTVRLRQLRREIRIIEAEAAELDSLRTHRSTRMKALLDEAVNVGLITSYESDEALEILQGIAANDNPFDGLPATDDPTVELRKQRNSLVERFRDIQDALRVARRYRAEQGGFSGEARQQLLRLKSVELFKSVQDDACPVCGHSLDSSHTTAKDLNDSIQRLDAQIATAAQEEPRLLDYIAKFKAESEQTDREIAGLDDRIQSLTQQQEAIRKQRERELAKGRAIGRISLFLESLSEVAVIGTAQRSERLARLKAEAAGLVAGLDEESQRERLASMTANLGHQIAEMADRFKLEHSGFSIRLDLRQLTLVIDQGAKSVPFTQIGSGENWVGYHLAFFLALHGWFRSIDRPVPAFLFIDQPTQVYFPPDGDSAGSLDELEDDDDRQAVRRMFEIMLEVITELHPRMQIIVTDHADIREEWFQKCVVERWRSGKALISNEWVDKIS